MPNVTTQSMKAIFQDLLFCPDFTIVAPDTVGPVSHLGQLQSVVQRKYHGKYQNQNITKLQVYCIPRYYGLWHEIYKPIF